MNEKEFLNHLQKQQDLEDEAKQRVRDFAIVCLHELKKKLKGQHLTLDQWKAKLAARGKTGDLAIIEDWEKKSAK
jgi:hypothetical protein